MKTPPSQAVFLFALAPKTGQAFAMSQPLARNQISFIGNAYEREARARRIAPRQIMWSREELNRLLGLYGRHVAQGRWRDYAIDATSNMAVFSVFKNAHDMPHFRIEKTPALRRQGLYAVVNAHGHVLKRSNHLERLLVFLDKQAVKIR
ncbi:MAG: DUF2794 domain-containing protein [Parvibaculales bacterium]